MAPAIPPSGTSEPWNITVDPDIDRGTSAILPLEPEDVRRPGATFVELCFLLFVGIPPVSFLKAGDLRSLLPLELTLYRIANIISLAFGIPAVLLSLLNNMTQLAGAFGICSTLCSIILFLLKEYRDTHKDWAPWLFETDHSIALVVVGCYIQMTICRVPSLLTMSQIRSRIGDLGWATQALVFTVTVDIVLCIFSGAIVLYAFKKGRLRWTFLHFLVEVAMIFLPRALYITVVIAVALRVDGSLDLLMQRLWSDLRLAFENAAGFALGIIVVVTLLHVVRSKRRRVPVNRLGFSIY